MNRLIQLLQGKTIAIVGNGNVREDLSSKIDSADIVVRFNHFYNYNSGNVGKRLDVLFQTVTNAWYNAKNKRVDVVQSYKPNVFLVKRPELYTSNIHRYYGGDIRIDDASRLFSHNAELTTGTCVLAYLAENLKNAEVKCYGFQDEDDWERYMATEATGYHRVKERERQTMMSSIQTLENLTITAPHEEMPRVVVIPIKANSQGAKDKNRLLIARCVNEAQKAGYPICVVGDDVDLLAEVVDMFGNSVTTMTFPDIEAESDVTETLREWKTRSGFVGEVALVQCTSPKFRYEWIDKCFDGLQYAPIAATACELGFKANAIYRLDNGVYTPNSKELPPASVARQKLPQTIRINGAVEAFHSDAADFRSIFDAGMLYPIIVSEADSLDVDTEEELREALGEIAKESKIYI